MPVTITDVPRLEKDGGGKIEVTTGDAAVPCVGVFSPSAGRAVLVFTMQEIEGRNIGLAYEDGKIRLTWPTKREKVYGMTKLFANPAPWEDLPAEIPCRVLDFPFYYVQLASYNPAKNETAAGGTGFAAIRDVQRRAMRIPSPMWPPRILSDPSTSAPRP